MAKVAATGQSVRLESYSNKLGRWYSVIAYRTQPGHFAVVFEDITDRKRAERALRSVNEELEQKVRERTADLMQAVDHLRMEVAQRRQMESELKATNEQLNTRAAQLRALSGELTMVEQCERRRLSRVLHDGLQQYLAAAKLRLGCLAEQGDSKIRQAASEIEGMLAESIRMSRSLSAELSPPVLHEQGLAAGLKWLSRWMRDKHNFSVELVIEKEIEPVEDIKILLFESVRELLFNAVKHAGTAGASVHLQAMDGKGIRLTVSDEGKGFDIHQIKAAGRRKHPAG